jgi:cyclophilin family peptidyl-prolyl cis-trans isomerase
MQGAAPGKTAITAASCSTPPFFIISAMLLRAAATLLLLATLGCSRSDPASAKPAAAAPKPPVAVLETEKGIIEIELLPGEAPKAVENFRLLADRGFYNGLTFHRIVKKFMIQTGDPQGDGRGGISAWGGTFDDEIQPRGPLYQGGLGYKRGIVAMANRGPNTNTSQFFIIHQDHPMQPAYTIFGRVTKGLEVVDTLAELPTQRAPTGENSLPVKPPVIHRVTIRP